MNSLVKLVNNKRLISFILLVVGLSISTNSFSQCASNATSTTDEDILRVAFGSLNNVSTCTSTGGAGSIQNEYSNYAYIGFPGGIPNIDRGCSISFSVQVGTCGGNYANSVAIYIDWNNDLDFIDAGENVYLSPASTTGPHTETGNITIPLTATLGNCKMRVICSETTSGFITPCGTYSWGETEDYFVNVTNSGGVAPYVSSTVSQLVGGSVSQCASLQQIICIPVVMGAGCTAGSLTQFQLGAGVSTNLLADVNKIHIFYTGSNNVYSAVNEFVVGGTVPTGASNTINGSQVLLPNATNYFWVVYDMNNSSTIGDLIDGSCSQITISGTNQIPSVINPSGNGTIVTCPCSFSLGNDVSLCAPINYTINGPGGFDSYVWAPGGATTQNLSVTSAGTYTCTATLINGGLVTNGTFSAGNTSFSTNYVAGSGGAFGLLTNPGTYAVTTSPNLVHNNFYAFGDHSSGTGNMLVCNGSSVANDVAWSQTITVTPNTFYNFSAWVASVENTSSGSEALLQFSINGSLIGPVVNAPLTGGVWSNFFVNWNSGANTSAIIKIVDQNISGGANDFALDDINFERVCTYSDIININMGSSTTVNTPSNIVVCNNSSVAISSFTSTPSGATFTWSNSNPSIGLAASGSGNTPAFNAINTGTNSVSSIVTVTPSIGGCPGTPSSYTITVNPDPIISVNNATTCAGFPTTLSASGATSYTWSTGATTSTISVSPTSTSIYSVSGEASGCLGNSTTTVIVNAIPIVTVNNSTVCSGISSVLTANGATTYSWSTGATTQTISVSPTITSIYTITGTTNGCSSTNMSTVTINSNPTITVNNATVCAGASATLIASGATTYSWTPNTGLSSSTGSIVIANPNSSIIYSVTGTANTCSGTQTSSVNVNAVPTLVINSSTICSGQIAVLTPTVSISGGTYTWLPSNQSTSIISVSPLATSNYSVTYSINGCSVNAASSVLVNTVPTITVNSVSICEDQTGTLNAIPSVTGGTYLWTPSGNSTSSITDAPTVNTTYNVLYSLNGCTASASGSIIVNSKPTLVLAVSTNTVFPSEEVILTASGGGVYIWNTSDTSSVITVYPQNTTTYCATLTSVAGCTNTNCIDIIIADESTLYIPNIFTPNNDGVNEIYYTPCRNIIKYDLSIFNRWGQLLFSSNDPLKGWDGSFNGKNVPDGVYVFILDAKGSDGKVYKKSGHITVLH